MILTKACIISEDSASPTYIDHASWRILDPGNYRSSNQKIRLCLHALGFACIRLTFVIRSGKKGSRSRSIAMMNFVGWSVFRRSVADKNDSTNPGTRRQVTRDQSS
jgi:hypothetical protein